MDLFAKETIWIKVIIKLFGNFSIFLENTLIQSIYNIFPLYKAK